MPVSYSTELQVFQPSRYPNCQIPTPWRAPSPLVRATPLSEQRQVFLQLGTMAYFAPHKYAPLSEQRSVLFPSNFGVLVLLLQGGGGGWHIFDFPQFSIRMLATWFCKGN